MTDNEPAEDGATCFAGYCSRHQVVHRAPLSFDRRTEPSLTDDIDADTRPEGDGFTAAMTAAMESSRRQKVEAEIRPVIDQVIADATRPWKRLVFWLIVGYGIFVALSVLQTISYWAR